MRYDVQGLTTDCVEDLDVKIPSNSISFRKCFMTMNKVNKTFSFKDINLIPPLDLTLSTQHSFGPPTMQRL